MLKLKHKEIKDIRNQFLYQNHLSCPLCEREVQRPVLDHNHKTGVVRNTICSQCNQMLGAIESRRARYGLNDDEVLRTFLNNVMSYIKLESEYIHPNHKKTPKTKK